MREDVNPADVRIHVVSGPIFFQRGDFEDAFALLYLRFFRPDEHMYCGQLPGVVELVNVPRRLTRRNVELGQFRKVRSFVGWNYGCQCAVCVLEDHHPRRFGAFPVIATNTLGTQEERAPALRLFPDVLPENDVNIPVGIVDGRFPELLEIGVPFLQSVMRLADALENQ